MVRNGSVKAFGTFSIVRNLVCSVSTRLAAFISEKFFRTKLTQLRKLLAGPTKPVDLRYLGSEVSSLKDFFKRFETELVGLGLNEKAARSIHERFDLVGARLDKLAGTYEDLGGTIEALMPYRADDEARDVGAEVLWHTAWEVAKYVEQRSNPLRRALRQTWHVEANAIVKLAAKVTGEATDQERADIVATDMSGRQYAFYDRVKLAARATRLVRRQKVEWDPVEWVDFIFKILGANYAVESFSDFTEFDLAGMKIVIEDPTIEAADTKRYVHFLDVTYQLLKHRGLQRAWYGTLFIRCRDCGGENPFGKDLGVAGHYHIGPDTIAVYARPDRGIVGLVAHELGHRFWFKQMSQEQRGRFESFVRVYPPGRHVAPPRTIEQAKVNEARQAVDDAVNAFTTILDAQQVKMVGNRKWKGAIDHAYVEINRGAHTLLHALIDAVHKAGADATINESVKAAFTTFLDAASAVKRKVFDLDQDISTAMHDTPEPSYRVDDLDAYWAEQLKRIVPAWRDDVQELLRAAFEAANLYIGKAVHDFLEVESDKARQRVDEWKNRYDADQRDVEPVSDYGKNNESEAFAEVFAHYVTGLDMDRRQLESFKAVLKNAAIRVADVDVQVILANMKDDLKAKMDGLFSQFSVSEARTIADWFKKNVRFDVSRTPTGQKALKDKLAKFYWFLNQAAGFPGVSNDDDGGWQRGGREATRIWTEEILPHIDDLVRYFTDEGGKRVPREVNVGANTYVNDVGFDEDKLAQYTSAIENVFSELLGWRSDALVGGVKVVLSGPKAFRGTAAGVYKSNEDTLYVRATPNILGRKTGTYGSVDYIIVHELGHRYERKHGTANIDFEKPEWWTTPYSKKEGEAFAELFAISNFGLHGQWDASVVDRFEKNMK